MELGVIRKIVIGDSPKNGMAYYIGMTVGPSHNTTGRVNAIVFDERHFHFSGKNRFLIYVEKDNEINLWKAIDNMPTMVEMDLNF